MEACVTSESNLLFWIETRRCQFHALAGPVTARTQILKIIKNYTITGTKYQDGLHKQIKVTTKLKHL